MGIRLHATLAMQFVAIGESRLAYWAIVHISGQNKVIWVIKPYISGSKCALVIHTYNKYKNNTKTSEILT